MKPENKLKRIAEQFNQVQKDIYWIKKEIKSSQRDSLGKYSLNLLNEDHCKLVDKQFNLLMQLTDLCSKGELTKKEMMKILKGTKK